MWAVLRIAVKLLNNVQVHVVILVVVLVVLLRGLIELLHHFKSFLVLILSDD